MLFVAFLREFYYTLKAVCQCFCAMSSFELPWCTNDNNHNINFYDGVVIIDRKLFVLMLLFSLVVTGAILSAINYKSFHNCIPTQNACNCFYMMYWVINDKVKSLPSNIVCLFHNKCWLDTWFCCYKWFFVWWFLCTVWCLANHGPLFVLKFVNVVIWVDWYCFW